MSHSWTYTGYKIIRAKTSNLNKDFPYLRTVFINH